MESRRSIAYDAQGRLIRWKLEFDDENEDEYEKHLSTCCAPETTEDLDNYIAIQKLEMFSDRLNQRLERRTRAINNWKRLRVLLAILKICGGRFDQLEDAIQVKAASKRDTFEEWMGNYILLPASSYFQYYGVLMAQVYLISLFLDPFHMSFGLVPLYGWKTKTVQSICSGLILIDILSNFITAYPKDDKMRLKKQSEQEYQAEEKEELLKKSQKINKVSMNAPVIPSKRKEIIIEKRSTALDDPDYEKRISMIAKNYLTGWICADLLACVPILIIEARNGFFSAKHDVVAQLISSPWYRIAFALKLLKFTQLFRWLDYQ